jgi:hypothetical protein
MLGLRCQAFAHSNAAAAKHTRSAVVASPLASAAIQRLSSTASASCNHFYN